MLKTKWGGLKIKHALLLYVLSISSVIWIFFLLLYLPQAAYNEGLRSQYRQLEQQVRIVETFALAHPDVNKYLLELDQKQASVDKMLPNKPEISEFILQVERVAQETGVQVVQIKPAAPVAKEGYQEIAVEILIRGNFFQTANFLNKMDNGPRFSVTQSLAMSSRQGSIDSKLVLSIYSYGVPPAQPPSQNQAQTGKKQ